MNFLDDVLNENEITENLRYFVSYWEYFCNAVEQPSIYTTIMTPHFLVREILNELNTNGTENSSTFKYFFSQNQSFLSKKYLFDEDSYSLWILLHEKLKEKEKQVVVIDSIVNKLIQHFSSNEFQAFLFSSLKSIVLSSEAKFDNIKSLTETIIFQFIFEQYSIKTIKKLINNIFSSYSLEKRENEKVYFHTNYPLVTNFENDDYEEYVKKASDEMNNLTLEKRLDRLYKLLINDTQIYYFIFYIKGIFFENKVDFTDVTFYNPKISPILDPNNKFENDIFNGENYEIGMNVIVKQKGKDIISAKLAAIKKINKTYDFILLHSNLKGKISINDACYRILDENKEFRSWSMGTSKDYLWRHDVIIDEESENKIINKYQKICNNENILEHDKDIIFDSLHFYRKAKESDSQEEKLLNYWIALERLFLDFDTFESKFDRTCNFVQSILLERFIFQKGWNCYYFIDNLLRKQFFYKNKMISEIEIPKELQIKANIGPDLNNSIIKLQDFVDSIPEIIKYSRNLVANDIMQNVQKFYYNHKFASKEILDKKEEIRNVLLMIYRQRNQIVHNAKYDNTLIEYNIAQAQSITTIVLSVLVNEINENSSIKDVALDFYIRSEQDIYLATKEDDYLFVDKLK
ncbi:MAG: hypothetical protein IJD23_00995 [Spirochaetaceae bacterium]|nr:hypothetical protein [Spirochaetaceae bacterium]